MAIKLKILVNLPIPNEIILIRLKNRVNSYGKTLKMLEQKLESVLTLYLRTLAMTSLLYVE